MSRRTDGQFLSFYPIDLAHFENDQRTSIEAASFLPELISFCHDQIVRTQLIALFRSSSLSTNHDHSVRALVHALRRSTFHLQ